MQWPRYLGFLEVICFKLPCASNEKIVKCFFLKSIVERTKPSSDEEFLNELEEVKLFLFEMIKQISSLGAAFDGINEGNTIFI